MDGGARRSGLISHEKRKEKKGSREAGDLFGGYALGTTSARV